MKKINSLKMVAICIAMALLGFLVFSRMQNVSYERDEISWYFHTKFFDEVFIKKNIQSPLWKGYESFDHPQISKYIYGGYLFSRDQDYAQVRTQLENKYGRWEFYYTIPSDNAIVSTEFAPILAALREINIAFTFFILCEIFVLFYMFSRSLLFSFLLSIALGQNELFMSSLAKITSDNHMLFFGLLAMLLYLYSLKSRNQKWIICAAIVTAFSVGAKLIGVFVFLSVILHEVARFLYTDKKRLEIIKRIGLYIIVALSVWVIINPALYRSPIDNTVRYFSFRSFQSANIAYHMPEVALHTVSEKIHAATCTLIIRSCKWHSAPGSLTRFDLLNILLLVLGLLFFYLEIRKRNGYIIFLVVLLYVFVMSFLTFLSNYSWRYFLFLQVIIFFIQMFGIWSFMMYIKQKILFIKVHRAHRK